MRHLAWLFLAALAACGPSDPSIDRPPLGPAERSDRVEPAAASPRIVALGDSLTAGLGLRPENAYPSLLEQRVREAGYEFDVVNAGVSGDTSAGGLRRLDWTLSGDVRALVVALGANDGLRGLPVPEMKKNLSAIIDGARRRGVPVLLCGMEAPPNFGPDYTAAFRQSFSDLARDHDVAFLPFLLAGVAGNPALNQGDGIHPNDAGAKAVADLVWGALRPILDAGAR
jgi:acyl-CoA thioesterase-1